CDHWQRVDGSEQIPGRERQSVVVVGRWTDCADDDVVPAPRNEAGDGCGIGPLLERVGEFAGEIFALTHAGVVEALAFLQRLAADRVDVRAADDDRDARVHALDAPGDLDRTRELDGHARDSDEIWSIFANARDDVVDGEAGQLPVEQVDRVPGRPQRAC